MCERKVKKDVPASVVSRAVCVSRAPPDDASRPALAGWGRPAWSLRVNLLSTSFFRLFLSFFLSLDPPNHWNKPTLLSSATKFLIRFCTVFQPFRFY